MVCAGLSSSLAQMVVEDVQGNTLKRVSLRIQAIEKKVSTASNIVLTAMSGDVTSTMEEIVRQNEFFENSAKLRSTLGDVITVSYGYRQFSAQVDATQNAIRRVDAKIREAQEGGLDEETIRNINTSLSRIRYALNEAFDLWSAATDLEDEIDRIVRLQKIQEAGKIISKIEETDAPKLAAEIEAAIYERLTKHQELSFTLPPIGQSILDTPSGGGGDMAEPGGGGDMAEFNYRLNSLAELWEVSVDKGRIVTVLEIVFGYGEVLAGIIMGVSLFFILRSRNTGKTYAVVRNIMVMLIAIVLMKVLAFNII
jgi:hypothetical protein